MRLRVLKLYCYNLANVIEVPCVLVIGTLFRERCLGDKVTSLFVKVLLQVASDDDVHHCRLSNLVVIKTARLVIREQGRSDRW